MVRGAKLRGYLVVKLLRLNPVFELCSFYHFLELLESSQPAPIWILKPRKRIGKVPPVGAGMLDSHVMRTRTKENSMLDERNLPPPENMNRYVRDARLYEYLKSVRLFVEPVYVSMTTQIELIK